MKNLASLSDLEKRILYLLLMDASTPAPRVARTVGCQPHTVQAALNKFRNHGLISRRIMVNTLRLGYSRHEFYISLSREGQGQKEAIAGFLIRNSNTVAVLEVGGEYDFFVSVVSRNAKELSTFQSALSVQFGAPFQRKDLALSLGHSVFGEKFLVSDITMYGECSYSTSTSVVEVDSLDRRILFKMCSPNFSGIPQLARSLGAPVSTIDYRVRRLR